VRQIFPREGPELVPVPAAAPGPLPPAVAEAAALYRADPRPGATGRPWLRANMVASADGASALDGRSGALGGPADRMVFNVLRSLADVILIGARTARAERYKPVTESQIWPELRAGKSPMPPIAVVSASLDFSDCQPLLAGLPEHAQTLIITTAEAAATVPPESTGSARLIVAGERRVDVSQAVAALVSLGHREILTEGGPHLLAQLTRAALLDELCLTTSPVLAAGSASRILDSSGHPERPAAAVRLELAHVLTDAGFLLSRYLRPAS
jgi:riboflavin biosynthesis pyrimidine reductase